MKKQLFLLAGVAAALASCTKTETVEQNPSTAIGFSSAWVGNSVDSKVDETTKDNLRTFQVYGGYIADNMTHVFDNVAVSSTDGQTWTYEGDLRYWAEGEHYKFAAYAPAEAATYGTVATDFASGALTFTDFVSNPTNQCDLIYATADVRSASADQGKVSFNFNHLLSMIKFTFKSGFAEDIEVTISDLKVYGMVSTGTYNQGWTTTHAAKVEEAAPFTDIDLTAEKTSDASSDDFAVIPQSIEGTDVTVSFTVNVANEHGDLVISNQPLSAQLPAIEWKAGNRYNYNVTISGSQVDLNPIEFGTPAVEPITSNEAGDINVQQ
ncbi:fimbrillin family protein [Millionella massiliensis]|uniref:fimbrillin family protein n=1 Tax=Millionella massiliensis TaxID=1871023 RepID=UPI0024B6F838|nr:fimbrillin family protein [Millionella massiliensis]